MDLARCRNAVRRYLADMVGDTEIIASDYLPDTAINGGVAFILSGTNEESDISGLATIHDVSVTLYVGKKTRPETDELIKRITSIPFRYSNEYCSRILIENVSDIQFNPKNDTWYGSLVTLTIYV